ncbi:hypothetical protein TL16_g05522 [Triparma laevis f. inornata]|nr:hypothetical protein TL16_g05522 [Triparma laevis f. inornata]
MLKILLLSLLLLPTVLSLPLTIIGASSTLASFILPTLPSHYDTLTLVTGPTTKSHSTLSSILPNASIKTYPEFDEIQECTGDCLFITPPSSFDSYSETLKSVTEKFAGKIILISSAGVYGNIGGTVTSATAIKHPLSPRQQRIYDGERVILSHPR